MKSICARTLVLALFLFAAPAFAGDMKFSWPVACTLGQNCWIVNYVDADPVKNSAKDFQCGDMTYDGHDGTDIAIKDHKAIEDNVNVLAAANGKVLRIRDSQEDGNGDDSILSQVKDAGKECGNGVVIAHENGWETVYCHMKKGSISVTSGQHVQKGDRLGAVGQSGLAAFPHLHFGVRHNRMIIDPFTGVPAVGCNALGTAALWDSQIAYNPLMLYAAGFSNREPTYNQLVNDTSSPQHIAADATTLTFWILFYGAQPSDRIEMEILDPDGKIYAQSDEVQKKKEIRTMRYIGVRTWNKPLHVGTYTGKAAILRALPDGQTIERTIESAIVVQRQQ